MVQADMQHDALRMVGSFGSRSGEVSRGEGNQEDVRCTSSGYLLSVANSIMTEGKSL